MSIPSDKMPHPISPGKSSEPVGTTPRSNKDFSSYMDPSQTPPKTAGTSPMELASQTAASPAANPSIETILNQSKTTQDTLGTVEKQLQTKDLKLKRSQTHLLKNKLSNAHGYIQQAGAKLGTSPAEISSHSGSSPIERFIAYVNDGQDQLVQVQQKLHEMSKEGTQINAADMLAVTVKMNMAQQEIEYSSTLLGKVIDSMKQIMNIQL